MTFARKRLALVLGSFALAACSADSIPPTATSSLQTLETPARRLSRQVYPNARKYRDDGVKPAAGRSGSAAIEVRALMAGTGVTRVQVTTGTFDGGTATGAIEKAQLTLVGVQSQAIKDKLAPAAPTWEHSLSGLAPGDQVQVQANVRALTGHRIEVVTGTATVVRLPDIAVGPASAPATAIAGVPVVITASVREVNGDLGARTTCVLLVDNAVADQAEGVWVNAGDEVTCQFSHAFLTAGQHEFRVQANSVAPDDWDLANNRGASSSITVAPPGTQIARGSASITMENVTSTYRLTRAGQYAIDSVRQTNTAATNVHFDGMTTEPIASRFERIEARGVSGDAQVYAETLELALTFEMVADWGSYHCTEYSSARSASGLACVAWTRADNAYSTQLSYWRRSGSVTYYGSVNYCGLVGCNSYTFNGDDTSDMPTQQLFDPAQQAGLDIAFVQANGERFVSSPRFPLVEYPGRGNADLTGCLMPRDGLGQACYTLTVRGRVYEGEASW